MFSMITTIMISLENGAFGIKMFEKNDKFFYYSHSYLHWNKIMHIINGNIRNSLKLAHWNGGPSYLGRQGRGMDKLETIKEILFLYKIDVLGISEANIETDIENSCIHIDGYKLERSHGDLARLCVFYKSDLKVKILDNNSGNSAAVWLEIGERKNK